MFSKSGRFRYGHVILSKHYPPEKTEAIVTLQSINLYVCNYDQASRKIRTEHLNQWSCYLLNAQQTCSLSRGDMYIIRSRSDTRGPHKLQYRPNQSVLIQLNAKLNMIVRAVDISTSLRDMYMRCVQQSILSVFGRYRRYVIYKQIDKLVWDIVLILSHKYSILSVVLYKVVGTHLTSLSSWHKWGLLFSL